jgi:small multidrug resistance pump
MWGYLAGAVLLEVCGTLALRMAAVGRPRWYAVVLTCYSASFGLLSAALAAGMGLGVAYGIWSASGVALIAISSRWLFQEPLSPLMGGGIVLIMAGVLLVELGRSQHL